MSTGKTRSAAYSGFGTKGTKRKSQRNVCKVGLSRSFARNFSGLRHKADLHIDWQFGLILTLAVL